MTWQFFLTQFRNDEALSSITETSITVQPYETRRNSSKIRKFRHSPLPRVRRSIIHATPDHSKPMHRNEINQPRLTTKIFSSIQEIPRDQWNGLLKGRSCSFSHEFWQVIEQSRLNDFDYRHIVFYDETGSPVAFASYYSITTDVAIFAPAKLRGLLGAIRRIFPNFLKVRMLECGTPITVNSPPFVAKETVSSAAIARSLGKLLLDTARAEGQFIIVIRDFEPNADALWPHFRRLGYHSVDSLPNTYMDITWSSPEDYLKSMKSYYRSKLQRHLRKNEAQKVTHELVDDFHDLAESLCSQWLVVHHQADEFQREILTPAFYREFSRAMGPRSKALLFYRQNELVGHALLLMDGDLLRWLYIGRKDAVNDSLYIYAGHKVIETAIKLGAKRLELGLTTYSIKQDLGAQMAPVKLALRSASWLINPFVGLGYSVMNHTPKIQNKNIFKQG
jgi:predicted N-acyltransferase